MLAKYSDVIPLVRSCATPQGLVNNAAMPQRHEYPWPLEQESLQYWETLMRLNVTAPWLLTKPILPHMVKGDEVRVLFITSEAGWAFTPGFGHYNISNAALNNLGVSMAEECHAHYPGRDIQINVLVPGKARTEMNQGSTTSPYAIASMALLLLSYPPGGPNGRFFHRDGRHLEFAYSSRYGRSLIDGTLL